jgi:phage terminase small subunit
MALTPQKEKFAQAMVEGKTQSDAYRAAYKVRQGTKQETINNSAYKIMCDGEVTARIEALRKPILVKVGITLESHLNDLEKLRNSSAKEGKWAAAISAEIARGRAAGLYIERVEHGGINGAPIENIVHNMTIEQYAQIVKQAQDEV